MIDLCVNLYYLSSSIETPFATVNIRKESMNGEILTIKEVSEYLKVKERTVYRLAADKKIPAFKVGGAWRFSRPEIKQWIKQQSNQGTGVDGCDN